MQTALTLLRAVLYGTGFVVLWGWLAFIVRPLDQSLGLTILAWGKGIGAVLLLALVMLGGAHVFVVLYEEPTLERRFGEAYRAYRRDVRRWLPRLPR